MNKVGYTYDEERELNTIDFEEAYQLLKEQVKKDNHILGCDCSKKDKEIERLNNIIKPKEINYNYFKLLFEKKDKEEVIKSYVYKCEQLEKLYKSYEEKEIEVMKKDNIIDELEKWLIDEYSKYNGAIRIANVLDKLKELKEGK